MKNYIRFNRDQWAKLVPNDKVKITKNELAKIKSLGDVVDLTDVHEIYSSLIAYLYLVYQDKRHAQEKQSEFLHKKNQKKPPLLSVFPVL